MNKADKSPKIPHLHQIAYFHTHCWQRNAEEIKIDRKEGKHIL